MKICLIGFRGRMGQRIEEIIGATHDLKIAARADLGDDISAAVAKAEVIIDFSVADNTAVVAQIAADAKKPLVMGTTGLDDIAEDALEVASHKVPIVYSPNMSVGVNLMLTLIEKAAMALGSEYKIDISETHHIYKKDRPSGTAKRMLSTIECARKQTHRGTFFEDQLPARKEGDESIRVVSVRRDEVVGDHDISFTGNGEIISISHNALTRDIFARGALVAARWIAGKRPGLYSMKDVLSI